MHNSIIDLSLLFAAVLKRLEGQQTALNQTDGLNHNHGDHMVQIFTVAVQAAQEKQAASMHEAMAYAGGLLSQMADNGSAQVYGRGLDHLSRQFSQRQVDLDNLLPYVREVIQTQDKDETEISERSAEVLKALLQALAEWEQEESQRSSAGSSGGMNMGYLFGVGMAYLQARQKGGDRFDILADTAVSASPLGRVPHRAESGRLVVRTLLQAMADQPDQ